MTFHDTSQPSPVIPTEQSERRDLGSILDVQDPEVGDEIPPLRGLTSAPVGMTIVGKRYGSKAEHDES